MTRRRSASTLEDVAKLAGVSTATVSRCLNLPEQVVESTREKVMRAIDELGYSPNFGARAMAANRTYSIGAIIPTMDNAIFARGLQAFQEELHTHGYTLLVASSAYLPDREAEQIKALIARGADGLLLIGFARDPSIYAHLKQRSVPALVAWAYDPEAQLPCIGFDNCAAMQGLARKVIEMGHRKIAMISGTLAGNDRAQGRLKGVQNALKAAGRDAALLPVIETPYGIESGAQAFEQLMTRDDRPTAVICGNDVLAAGAIRQAHQMGLRVPQDISITGFDDIELARILSPALSTVHVPHRQMGQQAAIELVNLVEGKGEVASKELGVSLRLRGSLAPPA